VYKVNVKWGGDYQPGVKPKKPRYVKVGDQEIPQRYELFAKPSDDDGRPSFRLVFEVVDGVPQCRGAYIESTDHGREVRRVDLDFPLEDYLEWATQVVGQLGNRQLTQGQHFEIDRSTDPFLRAVRSVRRTGRRRGPSDDQLREAVEVYKAADHAPTQAVADRFGIAHRTASLWMTRARQTGML
jgi:hypothetical protein